MRHTPAKKLCRAGRVCPGFLRPIQSFGTALEKLLPETPRAAKPGNGNAPVKTLLSGSYVLLTVSTHPPHRFWSTMTALFLVNDALHRLLGPPCPRRPSLGVDGIRMYGSHHKEGVNALKETAQIRRHQHTSHFKTSTYRQLPTALEDPGNLPPTGTDQPTVSCSRSPDTCLSFMRYYRSTYKPLHRMSPKLREKSRPYSQSFGPTTDTTYNRPAGFTQPGHPTVAPLWHLSSPEKNRRHQAGFPYGHSGKLLTQLTDARQPALPGN